MNTIELEIKMISRRKSRGFLGSIPKQVALWRVRMTVTMQSCKETQILAKNATISLIFLLLALIVCKLDIVSFLSKNGQKTPDKRTNCPDFEWGRIVSKLNELLPIETAFRCLEYLPFGVIELIKN